MSDPAYQELLELWKTVYGEAPAVVADARLTAQILVRCLPPVGPYRFKPAETEGEA